MTPGAGITTVLTRVFTRLHIKYYYLFHFCIYEIIHIIPISGVVPSNFGPSLCLRFANYKFQGTESYLYL